MFTRELQSRQLKFEKESAERRKQEREKADRLAKERLAVKRRREEAERQTAERKRFLEEQLEAEENRKQELREINRGVFFEAELTPLPLSEEVAIGLGIKRWKDKVVLPSSISNESMRQEAFKNGALLFELTAESGKSTHVGVLKFDSPEGTILIPPQIARRFWDEAEYTGKVKVSYRRLLDGTSARLQPIKHGFHEAVGDSIKDILEQTLSQYSTLTEGDVIDVEVPTTNQKHQLKVVELTPKRAVRILHTDLEVDVLPSSEVEEFLKERMRPVAEDKISFGNRNRLRHMTIEKQADSRIEIDKPPTDLLFQNKALESGRVEEDIGPEVLDGENTIACSVRLPDGTLLSRRFRLDDSLSNLFRFVALKGALNENKYKLVTQFPRRVISVEGKKDTFRDYGFDTRQAFFIEVV